MDDMVMSLSTWGHMRLLHCKRVKNSVASLIQNLLCLMTLDEMVAPVPRISVLYIYHGDIIDAQSSTLFSQRY